MSLLSKTFSLFRKKTTPNVQKPQNQLDFQSDTYTSYVPKVDINGDLSTSDVPFASITPLQDIEELSFALESQNRRYNRDLNVE